MGTTERLSALAREIGQIKTEIDILSEQAAFAAETAADANMRALVSETPLADREYSEARRDAEIAERSLVDARARLTALKQEQDRLLEQLFGESGG